jgi:hypothetical protein
LKARESRERPGEGSKERLPPHGRTRQAQRPSQSAPIAKMSDQRKWSCRRYVYASMYSVSVYWLRIVEIARRVCAFRPVTPKQRFRRSSSWQQQFRHSNMTSTFGGFCPKRGDVLQQIIGQSIKLTVSGAPWNGFTALRVRLRASTMTSGQPIDKGAAPFRRKPAMPRLSEPHDLPQR